MSTLATAAKAVYSGLVAALGSLATVLVGDSSLSAVTDGQWVTIVLAGLIAGGGTYRITNRAKENGGPA